MHNFNVIFFIGPQGSGKGTQAKILAKTTNFFHWDNGAILRQTAQAETELGQRVKNLVENGIYLDDSLLFEVAKTKLVNLPKDQGIIFDGLPRRITQAKTLIEFLKNQGRDKFATVFIDIPKEETMKRLTLRAQIEGRADDTPEKIERRLQQYYDETVPVLNFLKENTSFYEIDGQPQIEQVTQSINTALGI